uniref:MYND-type domain-containing protein n=1 Tax=Branchiostoma floridae TaxID=7739 RepID=C3Y5G1_BRAFL|eukprot:XP_002608198.1 hypothetical protein BRAFLDRAFT_90370 [Branchiostoma floridae]
MAYFQALFDRICGDLQRSTQEMSSDFLQLSTNQQRVSYALSIPSVHSYIKVKPMFKGKSAMEATKLREFGNKMFGQKDYDSALQMYSESVLKAPFDPNINHPVAHGNMNGSSHGRAQCDKNDVTADDGNEFSLALANRRVSAPLPCQKCSTARYCSHECADLAWTQYHGVECQYLGLIHSSGVGGMGHLALRLVNRTGFHFLQEFERTLEDKISRKVNEPQKDAQDRNSGNTDYKNFPGLNDEGVYTNDYNSVYNLENHSSERKPSDLFRRTVMAIFLLRILQNGGFFRVPAEEVAEEDQLLVASYLQSEQRGRHAVAAQDIRVGDVLIVEKPYGSVVLPEQGDTHCDYCCSCQPCAENWPLFYDMVQDLQRRNKLPKLKCRQCFSVLPGSEDKVLNKMKCAACGEEQELQVQRTQLDSIVDEVFTKVGVVVTGEVESSLPALERCLERMEKLVARPYGYYDSCQEAIKQCYGIVGNCYERTTS